jgi:RND family efflux transporter MFP subunit
MHVGRHRVESGATKQAGFPRGSTHQASAFRLPCAFSMSRPLSRRSRAMTNMNNVDKRVCRGWRTLWLIAPTVFTMTACTRSTQAAAPPSAAASPSIQVAVAEVEQKDVPIYGQWIGTLEGLVNADVKAQVTGYLLTREYKEGSFVKKGQLLFQIDSLPFQAALDQAKGQLAQARAQLVNAEANERKSQLDVEKYGPLAKAQAASQQDLDNAVQTNLANQATVETAKASIQAAEAAVETAQINLNFTRVASPINGIAGVAKAQVGDLVGATSGTLTTVSTLDPIRDYFTVSEQEYLTLRKQFSSSANAHWPLQLILADGTTYPHQGDFYFVDRAVNQSTGAIQVAALFPNPGNVLRPGQYGRVRALVQVQHHALVIPQAAVIEQQGSYQVDLVDSDGRVAMRPVKVGPRMGMMWVIQDGVKPGERVVVEGQLNLRPGMTVQPKPFKGIGE